MILGPWIAIHGRRFASHVSRFYDGEWVAFQPTLRLSVANEKASRPGGGWAGCSCRGWWLRVEGLWP